MENLINDWQAPVNIEMVYVEGGTFTMGATPEQGDDVHDWEKPAHQVTVSSFGIGKYPVTQEQWEAVMVKNPSFFPGDSNPVERVNCKNTKSYCRERRGS
jgi:formylglycine-generating enzyme required for sulfatase activity